MSDAVAVERIEMKEYVEESTSPEDEEEEIEVSHTFDK